MPPTQAQPCFCAILLRCAGASARVRCLRHQCCTLENARASWVCPRARRRAFAQPQFLLSGGPEAVRGISSGCAVLCVQAALAVTRGLYADKLTTSVECTVLSWKLLAVPGPYIFAILTVRPRQGGDRPKFPTAPTSHNSTSDITFGKYPGAQRQRRCGCCRGWAEKAVMCLNPTEESLCVFHFRGPYRIGSSQTWASRNSKKSVPSGSPGHLQTCGPDGKGATFDSRL